MHRFRLNFTEKQSPQNAENNCCIFLSVALQMNICLILMYFQKCSAYCGCGAYSWKYSTNNLLTGSDCQNQFLLLYQTYPHFEQQNHSFHKLQQGLVLNTHSAKICMIK